MFDSREFSYADTKVSMFAMQLTGLRGLTFKDSQEKDLVYGQGNKPKAIQPGLIKYEGNLILLKSDYDLLHDSVVAAGYKNLLAVPAHLITITCVHCKQDDRPGLTTDTLLSCGFTEVEDGMKTGDKFKEITLPFIFLDHIKV